MVGFSGSFGGQGRLRLAFEESKQLIVQVKEARTWEVCLGQDPIGQDP